MVAQILLSVHTERIGSIDVPVQQTGGEGGGIFRRAIDILAEKCRKCFIIAGLSRCGYAYILTDRYY
jgi:hypothetical protein